MQLYHSVFAEHILVGIIGLIWLLWVCAGLCSSPIMTARSLQSSRKKEFLFRNKNDIGGSVLTVVQRISRMVFKKYKFHSMALKLFLGNPVSSVASA